LLAALLTVAGCKQQAAKEADAKVPEAKPVAGQVPDVAGPQKFRKGFTNTLPSVQRGLTGLDLRSLAQMYYTDFQADAPPKKVEDLKGLDAQSVKAIKDGDYVVFWNIDRKTPTNAIIAYEKTVPTQGGMVARLDGSVTKMTKAEFDAAPKAVSRK
jgi:hypothetical protein